MTEVSRFTRGETITYKSKNSGKETEQKVLFPLNSESPIPTSKYKALIIPEFLNPLPSLTDIDSRQAMIKMSTDL